MAVAPFRLAVLECDSPISDIIVPHAHLTSVFKALFRSALPLLPPTHSLSPSHEPPRELLLTRHHVVRPPEPAANLPPMPSPESTYPDLDAIDALLISGSKHDSFSDHEWVVTLVEFVRRALQTDRIKIIGVCFGHQILGRALGAQVRISPDGREAAVSSVDLTDEGKAVFGLEKMRIQQMHRDELASVPEGAILLGSTPKCLVQAYYSPGKYISVQGHPETTPPIMTQTLTIRNSLGIFSDEFTEASLKNANLEDDGHEIGRAFLEFVTQ